MTVSDLPLLNAILNSTSAVLLLIGHRYIRQGNRRRHKSMMISAFATSSLFLVSYIVYHALHGSQHFQGQGIVRSIYFLILGTHTVLAAAIVPLVLITLSRALRGSFDRHRIIARWAFPIWLYVSVTGVVIYLMLYRLFPGGQSI